MYEKLINPYIKNVRPYIPGKPIKEVMRELGLENVLKMASNENAIGPSHEAVEAIVEALGEINRYPDSGGYYLKQALCPKLGISENQVVFGNGSNEIIELVTRTFLRAGEEAIIASPSFQVYNLLITVVGGIPKSVPLKGFRFDLDAMLAAVTSKTKMIFIDNPNNPVGCHITAEEFESFMSRVPDGVIVIADEAYYDFIEGESYPDSVSYIDKGYPVIAMRTFSKMYGLSGLRIGYGIAHPDAVAWMNKVRQPFNCNSLAQAAAVGALGDNLYVEETRKYTREGKKYIYAQFERMGLEYIPSSTNFILFDSGKKGKDVFLAMQKRGVIIRAMDSYDMPSYLRVTIGREEENKRFIEVLEQALSEV